MGILAQLEASARQVLLCKRHAARGCTSPLPGSPRVCPARQEATALATHPRLNLARIGTSAPRAAQPPPCVLQAPLETAQGCQRRLTAHPVQRDSSAWMARPAAHVRLVMSAKEGLPFRTPQALFVLRARTVCQAPLLLYFAQLAPSETHLVREVLMSAAPAPKDLCAATTQLSQCRAPGASTAPQVHRQFHARWALTTCSCPRGACRIARPAHQGLTATPLASGTSHLPSSDALLARTAPWELVGRPFPVLKGHSAGLLVLGHPQIVQHAHLASLAVLAPSCQRSAQQGFIALLGASYPCCVPLALSARLAQQLRFRALQASSAQPMGRTPRPRVLRPSTLRPETQPPTALLAHSIHWCVQQAHGGSHWSLR